MPSVFVAVSDRSPCTSAGRLSERGCRRAFEFLSKIPRIAKDGQTFCFFWVSGCSRSRSQGLVKRLETDWVACQGGPLAVMCGTPAFTVRQSCQVGRFVAVWRTLAIFSRRKSLDGNLFFALMKYSNILSIVFQKLGDY